MKRRNSETIGDVLRAYIQENNLESKIFEQKLIRAWPEVLGDEIAAYTSRLNIRQGTLYVSLTSAVVRNELMMKRAQLIRSLNQKVGADVIKQLIFR